MRSLKPTRGFTIFSILVLVVSTVMALSKAVGVWHPFNIHAADQSNSYISRLTRDNDGIYTLRIVGMVGVEYVLEATANITPPVAWEAVPGSTHLVTEPHGQREVLVTAEEEDFWFFRLAVITP